MITKDEITEIFCIIDEFCKYFEQENGKKLLIGSDDKKRRMRKASMSDSEIMTNGGQIFLALDDNTGELVGCCALINHPDKDSYELAKMAVSPHTQGHHIGHQLRTALIDYARKIGAKRLYLEGNTKLEASIHLYRKLGFHEISLEGSTYDRCDIIMELKL